jgi:predicted homoserine dehydrogenase-like protein
LPLGLAHGVKLVRSVASGQPVKWRDVAFDPADTSVQFRRQMEAEFQHTARAA